LAFGDEPSPQAAAAAFAELSELVHHLGDELASFRRRALSAEARLRAVEDAAGTDLVAVRGRISDLEEENAELRDRLSTATERTRQMLERVRFLRQQHGLEA
jgi:predicted  nucleic acid-binding Zn-ribbon protein